MTNTVSPGVDQPPSSVRDLLATAIAEVTGLDDASLDAQANPIELGIDSLMIMQINTRLHRSLGVELPNELFFDPAATLAQLTQQLAEQAEPARVEALATGSGEGEGSATGPAADTTAGTALVPSASESLPSVAIGQAGGLPQAPSAGLTEVQGLTPPQAIAPVPAPAAPAGQPDAAGRSMLESLMHQQLQTFAELTRQQIEAFQRVGSAPPPPSAAAPLQAAVAPAPPAPQATADPTTAQPARPRSSVQRDDPASASPKAIPTAPPSAATPPVPPLPDQGVATERKPFVPYRAVSEAATRARPTITDTALGELTREYCAQTPTTKSRTQTDRAAFANNRNIAGFTPALKEMTYQVIAERASGAHIWDPDGNRFVDITQGFGSSLLGHSHPAVAEAIREQLDRTYAVGPISNDAGDVARRICRLTGAERVAFYNSGTEAVMVATRLARTATGRAKVVCFEGAYHGMFDGVLALPDRGASTPGTAMPLAPGVTEHMVADTVVLPYNDPESLQIIEQRAEEVAAVIVEPVQSRRPDVKPRRFLQQLRALTERIGSALIFDEVVTGFRAGPGGAQAWFGVRADLAAYGKIIGGGMPIGVVAGKARFLDGIDGGMWTFGDDSRPTKRNTYVAGTFCSHPLTMAASKAVLAHLESHGPALQRDLNARTRRLCARLNNAFADLRLPIHVVQFASLFRFVLPKAYEPFWYRLQVEGVYVWEGRNCMLSTAHDEADIEYLVAAVHRSAAWLAQSITGDAGAATGMAGFGIEELPASAPQRVMFARAQRPHSAEAYHVPAVYTVEGPLDPERFEAALTELCERHEALRTSFVERDGELLQRIHPVADFELQVQDTVDDQGIDELVQPLLQPFDLTQPGLLRCAVAPLGADRHLLALNLHHLIADGVTLGLLVDELLRLVAGHDIDAAPAVAYRDYVAWEQAYLASADAERDESRWRERLAGLPARIELPRDVPGNGPRDFGCRRIGQDLSAPERLRAFAREQGVTLNMLLHGVFQVWLSAVSGRDEIYYGSPTSGRPAGGFENTLGLFIGIVVYRARLDAGTRFADLLAAVRSDTTALLKLQHVPFERVQALMPQPDDGGTPFEVGINYDGQMGPFQVGDLRVSPRELDTHPGMSLACVLDFRDIGERLRLDIAHDPGRYSRELVTGWAHLFDQLAQALTAAPEQPVRTLLGEATRADEPADVAHQAA